MNIVVITGSPRILTCCGRQGRKRQEMCPDNLLRRG